MSFQPEQPFNEFELRYFLSEILKQSAIPPAELVQIIQDRNINPRWDYMALPNGMSRLRPRGLAWDDQQTIWQRVEFQLIRLLGRSAASCRNQFDLLTNRGFGASGQAPGSAKPKKKRPSSGVGQLVTSEPSLLQQQQQQQQFQFAPINDPSNPAAFQNVPFPPERTAESSGKKRGRPSKAEREIREAEAAARGEVYQPTKRKPKTPRPSMEGAEVGGEDDTPGSKKKPKKQRTAATAFMGPPGHPSPESGISQATGSPADQMQVDTPERVPRSTIPETQASEYPASESLQAAMRAEPASYPGPRGPSGASPMGTTQSSATLQQEFPLTGPTRESVVNPDTGSSARPQPSEQSTS